MKKIMATALAALILSTALVGCGRNGNGSSSSSLPSSSVPSSSVPSSSSGISTTGNTLTEGTTLEQVIAEVNRAFGEAGAVTTPGKLNDEVLMNQYGIDPADVEEYYGEYSTVNTNSDMLVAVRAKPDKVDEVRTALEKKKSDMEKNFSSASNAANNGAYDRIKAAKVYVRGDYVFLISVGAMPTASGAATDFNAEVTRAQEAIDKFFK